MASKKTIAQLRHVGTRLFRVVPTGSHYISRNGRRVAETTGVTYFKTEFGEITDQEWYAMMREAIVAEGKEELFQKVKEHCEKLAWLKTDKMVEEYAMECLSSEAYKAWPEWKTA